MLTALGTLLAELELVPASLWQAALKKADGPNQLNQVIEFLTRTPARWSPPGAPCMTVTSHQQTKILECVKTGQLHELRSHLRWHDYLILEVLGRGGMGEVHKGWDVQRKSYVALKRPQFREGKPKDRVIQRFYREADLTRSLDHPHIAHFISLEEWEDAPLLVLEYIGGRPLSDLVEQRKKESPGKHIPWKVVVGWGIDLLGALDYAHGNNPQGIEVLHRDIKPSNVMMRKDRDRYVPKLLDLGLGKFVESADGDYPSLRDGEDLTRPVDPIGTPAYMPPEQWDSASNASAASDIYCLAGTLVFALTMEPPFGRGEQGRLCYRHHQTERPSVRAVRGEVPEQLDQLLQRMLAVEHEQRGTAAELIDEFQRLLQAPEPAPAKPRSTASVPVPVRKAPSEPELPRGTLRLDKSRAEPPVPVPVPETFPSTGEVFQAGARFVVDTGRLFFPPDESISGEATWSESRGQFLRCARDWLRSLARPLTYPVRTGFVVLLFAGLGWAIGTYLVAFFVLLLIVGAAEVVARQEMPPRE